MLVMKEGKALYRRCRVGNCFYKIRKRPRKGKFNEIEVICNLICKHFEIVLTTDPTIS